VVVWPDYTPPEPRPRTVITKLARWPRK